MIYTDASNEGWGTNNNVDTTGGQWSIVEAKHHINYLELKAVLLGLQSLCKDYVNSHIKVMTDNTTTVAYIRNMGGSQSLDCNEIARAIWLWCLPRDIWLTVSHIPGQHNVVADRRLAIQLLSGEVINALLTFFECFLMNRRSIFVLLFKI